MESIRLSSKGQMIIPRSVRQALDIRVGAELGVELLPDNAFKVSVKTGSHADHVRRTAGMLARKGGKMSDEREQATLLAAVALADRKTISRRKSR